MSLFTLLFLTSLLINFIYSLEHENEKIGSVDSALFNDNLSKKDQELKMSICLKLTQSELVNKRDFYQEIAESIIEKNGVSHTDVLKSVFHQRLAACYFNSEMQDIIALLNGNIEEKDLTRIFNNINNETSNKFSKNELNILENLILSDTGDKLENNETLLFYRLLYLICIISAIGIFFYLLLNKLKHEITKGKIKKKNT